MLSQRNPRKAQHMTFKQQFLPQYSQTEADLRVGCLGYMRYFQDTITRHLLSVGKGNDTIPQDYGICWIVSKYRLHVVERASIEQSLIAETWIEPEKSKVRLHPNLRVTCGDKTMALGQMELCLAHVGENRIALLPEIEFPFEMCEEPGIAHPKARKLRFADDGLEQVYTRTVRYSDLDNNRHMNNQHYVNVALDAFPGAFHLQHPARELELEYLGQCREGETMTVHRAIEDDHAEVLARNDAGEIVLKAVLAF